MTAKDAFTSAQLDLLDQCFNYTEEELNDGFFHLVKRSRKRRRKLIERDNQRNRRKKLNQKFDYDKIAYRKKLREKLMENVDETRFNLQIDLEERKPGVTQEKIDKQIAKMLSKLDKQIDAMSDRVYSNKRREGLIDLSVTASKAHPATLEEVFTFDNLLDAYNRVCRGKKMRKSVIWYHMNYFTKLYDLQQRILSGKYQIGRLSQFKVYEPKEREVVANQFEDKIVQDVIAKHVLGPLFKGSMVYDNYASQPGKGTLLAVNRLERYMKIHAKSVGWTDEGWVLMGDLKKFFYTIDHEALFGLIKELPIDSRLEKMIRDQINVCTSEINPYTDEDGKGLCIGFETSQWSAVYYLNKMDHYIKEELGIKCYGRYMDDFYLIHKDREYLEQCMEKIREYVKVNFKMELNKKTFIHPFRQGVCFLGYHLYYNARTHDVTTVIRNKSINNMRRRLRRHMKQMAFGKLDIETALMSLTSWYSYALHGDTEQARNAYKKAVAILMGQGTNPYTNEYVELCSDWENIDSDDFFRLLPDPNAQIRDADGYAVLLPYKQSKNEKIHEINRGIIEDNQEPYIARGMTQPAIERRIISGRSLSDTLDDKLQQAVNIMDNVCQELFKDDE